MEGPILAGRLAQVGIIVRDLETSKKKFAELFGVPVPPSVSGGDDFSITQTVVDGKPAPDANCHMAFFDLENIQLELIEPNGCKSAWQDYLDEYGEGIHHIAFPVKGTDEKIKAMEQVFGAVCLQRGKYGDGSGEYAYLDVRKDLKCYMETLESFNS